MKAKPLKWERRNWRKPDSTVGTIDESTWHAEVLKQPVYSIKTFDGLFYVFWEAGHCRREEVECKTLEEAQAVAQAAWEKFIAAAVI